MAEQDYATVSGEKVHKSDFAYAPPGSEPSEWKLPIHDASHVRNALARFNQTQLPAGAKAAALAKIHAAAKKFGIDAKEKASDAPRVATLLTNAGAEVETPAGMAMQRPGAQLREIAVAVPGSWVKGDHGFSITKQDLRDMAENFAKRKNDMIVIDYEHASEQPEVAKGGPVPGAGWIHGLNANGALTALVEWTPQAEEMLRTGQYRFFSPAIDWGAADKETGKPQGATLTSGALTNHPFLEELPPIMLSDGTVISKGAITMAEKEKKENKEKLEDPEEELAETKDDGGDEKEELPKLKIRKGRKGSKHEGKHVLSAKDGDVGYLSEEDLRAHAAKHLGVNPDDDEDDGGDDAKKEMSEARRRTLILTEVAPKGRVESERAIALADAGKITFADYVRAQEAEKTIDAAVREGKILPRDRKFFFRDALERPSEFTEYLKSAQAVQLGMRGIGEGQAMTPDQEVETGTKQLMSEKKLDYPKALKQFLGDNPALAGRYRAAHSSRVNADGTAN